MRKDQIVTGAELYFAPGPDWRFVPPKKATVVDPGPYRINTVRQGAFYTVQPVRDDAGTAVLVRLDGENYGRAVPRRELRGLWLETLAATGWTAAGVKAADARLHELGAGEVTVDGVLRVAACDEALPDDVFTTIANHIEGE